MNGPSFTSKGTKYFHQFNISLCGGQVGGNEIHTCRICCPLYRHSNPAMYSLFQGHLAVCTDNVTDMSIANSQRDKGEAANAVKTFICQSTIIPASGRGFHTALSSQSINLADTFLGKCVIEKHQRYYTLKNDARQKEKISFEKNNVSLYYINRSNSREYT